MPESVDEHLAWVLERITPTERVAHSPAAARGLALAESVHAQHDLPMWDASAMDGYAVHAADTAVVADMNVATNAPVAVVSADAARGTPASWLRVVGEVVAGSDSDPNISRAEAARVMTGAPVPNDADAVIAVEATESDQPGSPWAAQATRPLRAIEAGANIRRRGEDVRAGEIVGKAGDRLTAARASALAAVGVASVRVYREPRIAVVTTGSELQEPGQPLGRGRIPESNSVLVAGMLADAGFDAVTIEHSNDDPDHLTERLTELARAHDLIVTTGGIGPGTHDVVRMALENEPAIRAVRVAMRPGQLQRAGRHSAGAFLLGLPGNPVSVAASFEMFVRPAVLALAGHSRIHRLRLTATATESWEGKVGRLKVLPVRIEEAADGLTCAPAVASSRVSHSVATHGECDGYAIVEADRGGVHAGEQVQLIQTGLR